MLDAATLSHDSADSVTHVLLYAGGFIVTVAGIIKLDIANKIAAFIMKGLSRPFRPHPPPPPEPTEDEINQAAQRLAKINYGDIQERYRRFQLTANKLLPVRWRIGSHSGGKLSSSKIFDDISAFYNNVATGRMVILGRAGAGKSILVQRLALDLLGDPKTKEHRDSAGLVPVIFNLSSWRSGESLDSWLIDQLTSFRHDPALSDVLAKELITSGRILPILDGFDEVALDLRFDFLDKLAWDPERRMVLTSRPSEYANIIKGSEKKRGIILPGAVAIELSELSLTDSLAYLLASPYTVTLPGSETEVPAWKPVADELVKAPQTLAAASLTEVLKTPLMVTLARDVYRYGDPKDLPKDLLESFSSPEDIEGHLLKSFVPAIYKDTPENPSRFNPAQAMRAFRYLASHLEHPGNTHGEGIAWWQLGIVAMSPLRRSLVYGLVCGLVMAVANGVATFAAVLGADSMDVTPAQGVELVVGDATAIGLAFTLVHWLMIRYRGGAIEPSWADLMIFGREPGERAPVDQGAVRRFLDGFAVGGAAGFIGIFGVLSVGQIVHTQRLPDGALNTVQPGWLVTVPTALGIAVILGVAMGNVAILQIPVKSASAAGPFTLLDADRRLAMRGGALAGVMSGIGMGLVIGFEQGAVLGIAYAAVGAIAIGIGGAVSVTAWGQWLIFGRVWLPLTGKLPWRAREFREDAHDRGVLRQDGGFDQFRHDRLQKLYAASTPETPDHPAGRTTRSGHNR